MTASERIRGARDQQTNTWYDWRNSLTRYGGALRPMVAFEQLAKRSQKEKRCAECGDPGIVAQPATRYNHVPYWFCDSCNAYWKTA